MSAHVALLRGVNVGGRNKVPMAALAGMFRAAGARDVRTYVQSGNVVFEAASSRAAGIAASVGAALEARLGFTVPIILRTGGEMGRVAEGNPFLREKGIAVERLHVGFLAKPATRAAAAALDPDRSPGDRFHLRGDILYLHLPNGVARTRLTSQYLDSRLGTVVTIRNWNTVMALRDLTKEA